MSFNLLTITIYIYAGFLIQKSLCQCPNQQEPIVRGRITRITYSTEQSGSICTWQVPSVASDHQAIVVAVKEAELRNPTTKACGAFLHFPLDRRTCDAKSQCRVYVRENSTCKIGDIMKKSFSYCTKTLIHFDQDKAQEVKLEVQRQQKISLNIQYTTIDCNAQIVTGRKMILPTTTAARAEQTTKSTNGTLEGDGQTSTGISSGTIAVIAVIVILAFLLVATCVMLVIMYRRKEKAVTFQNPAVVAYVHGGYEDDSGSSAHDVTEYLEFHGNSVSATASSESIATTSQYAEIRRKTSIEIATDESNQKSYENLTKDFELTQDDMKIETSFTSNCTYAVINKANKTKNLAT